MSKKKKQSPMKRFFASRLFLMVTLVVVVFIALSYARAYYRDYQVRQQIAELQEEVRHLERKKLESMEVLEYVTSEAFVEEKARTELNLKKPGENVVYVYEQEELETEGDNQVDSYSSRQIISNPLKWWYYFTKHQLPDDAI